MTVPEVSNFGQITSAEPARSMEFGGNGHRIRGLLYTHRKTA